MIKYIFDLRPFEAFFRPKTLDWLSQNCAKLSERSKLYGLAVKATKSGVENWPRQRVLTGLAASCTFLPHRREISEASKMDRCLQLLFSVPSAGVQLFNQELHG